MNFVKVNNKLINPNNIATVRCEFLEEGRVTVHYSTTSIVAGMPALGDYVEGQQAIDLLMQLNPSMLEGKRLKFAKHHWAFHNLIAHPMLQILSWFGRSDLGFKIHDATIPRPTHKSIIK